MRGIFDDEETEPRKKRRDTELTLGSGTLLFMFFGLVLLCGLCFGLGYTMGRYSSPPPSDSLLRPAPTGQPPLQANAALTKPSAAPPGAAVSPVQAAGIALATAASEDAAAQPGTQKPASPAKQAPTQSSVPNVKTSSPPVQAKVQPALASQPVPPRPSQPAAAPSVHPALPSTASFMVQVAAVASPEDAEVLMSALRQRGYAVTVRRNLTDNLIHIRVGPFTTRAIADQWRQKLLNDGYNAVVQP